MTKKKIVILCISILLIIGILVGAYFYFFTNAFKPLLSEVLGYEGKSITKMVVTPVPYREETTDPDDIAEVVNAFKGVKVTATKELDHNRDGGHPLVYFYCGEELIAEFSFHGNTVISGDIRYTIDKEIPLSFRNYLETKYTLF